MTNNFKIACLQTRPMPNFDSALQEMYDLAVSAVKKGAKLIALPEYCGGLVTQGSLLNPPSALEENHKVLTELKKFSSKFKVFILIGSIAISSSNGTLRLKSSGQITASNAKIAGQIDATSVSADSGSIGGFTLSSTSLFSNKTIAVLFGSQHRRISTISYIQQICSRYYLAVTFHTY